MVEEAKFFKGYAKRFAHRYTLIDNFDKFDLHTYQSLLTVLKYEELAHPSTTSAFIDGAEELINNYINPFAFDWERRPDLLRFLTNRRFYLRSTLELAYPTRPYLWVDSNLNYVKPEEILDPLEGKRFLISLTHDIMAKLNTNFSLTNSFISFTQYFTNEGYEGTFSLPPLTLGFGSTNYSDVLADVQKLRIYIEKLLLQVFGRPVPYMGAVFLNLPKTEHGDWPTELPSDILDAVKVLSLNNTLPGLGGEDGISPEYWTLFRLINRLLSFVYQQFTAESTIFALKNPVHFYLVGEFPLGGTTPPFGSGPEDFYGELRKEILSINPFYNYYAEGVTEHFTQASFLAETQLPNLYTFYAYKSQPENLHYYERLVNFGLDIPLDHAQFNISDYYNVIDAAAPHTDGMVANRYKKIVFGNDLSLLGDAKSLKKNFPYGVQIDLPQVYESEAIKIFQEFGLIDKLTSLIGNYSLSATQLNSYAHRFISVHHAGSSRGTGGGPPPGPTLVDCQLFNLTEFFEKIPTDSTGAHLYLQHSNDNLCVKFGEILGGDSNQQSVKAGQFMAAKTALWTYFNQKKVSFWDMYNGEKCHTEVLLFEIAKFKRNTITGARQLVQSIFIPNLVDATEMLSYIDTQVFVGTEYTYEIFTHTLLLGNVYKFLRKGAAGQKSFKETQVEYQLGYTTPVVTAALAHLGGQEKVPGQSEGDYGWSASFTDEADASGAPIAIGGAWLAAIQAINLESGGSKTPQDINQEKVQAYLDAVAAYHASIQDGADTTGGFYSAGGIDPGVLASIVQNMTMVDFLLEPEFVIIGFGGQPTIINLIPTDKTYPYAGISSYLLQTLQLDTTTLSLIKALANTDAGGGTPGLDPGNTAAEGLLPDPAILKMLADEIAMPGIAGDVPPQTSENPEGPGIESDLMAILVRAPYHNTRALGAQKVTLVISKPPLPPDIGFYPYENIDNKVLILLNQSLGTQTMIPIPVFDGDQKKINAQFVAQKYEKKPASKLIYKADDTRGFWQIYRTTQPPHKYSDFQSAVPTIIDSTERSGYNDNIVKNKDYYYMARFVDTHGNISNPTIVFYVRIVKEGGFPPYMIVKEYNMTQGGRNVDTVAFKKFIKIKLKDVLRNIVGISGPTATVSYQTPGSKGLSRYKFRITSKKTGKQIDINVRFNKLIIDAPAPNFINPFISHPSTTAVATQIGDAINVNVTTLIKENEILGLGLAADGSTWGTIPEEDV